jgi:cobalt-zinc-cadmium efflux system outer membrane protein
LPLRHSIVEQTQAEYNAMLVGAFDVLTVKQDEIEAGASYVAALRDYWLARSNLEQVVNGRIAEQAMSGNPGNGQGRSESRSSDDH